MSLLQNQGLFGADFTLRVQIAIKYFYRNNLLIDNNTYLKENS